MNLNANVNVRVREEIKANAEKVLAELGLTMSEAINVYLRQIALRRGLPFAIRLPNRKTVRAMRDIQERRNLTSVDTPASLEQNLNS